MKILNYLQIIRPKNLVIVAISQLLIYLVYLFPLTFQGNSISLNDNLWILFIIDTVLIAAGGYIINDLMDQKADAFNKPTKVFIGSGKISPLAGWIYYGIVVILGFCIASFIADRIDKMYLLAIYPVAVGLLFMYSFYFKQLPLIGNLIVSIFCAFVPGIILYAEYDTINFISETPYFPYDLIMHFFPAYISFAFLSTFVREIIKDIEDMEGDMKSAYRTLPIMVGVERANVMALFFAILLLCSYAFWFFGIYGTEDLILGLVIVVGLVVPTLYIIRAIYRAKSTADYSSISKMLKYLMIVSLFVFLCIPFIYSN